MKSTLLFCYWWEHAIIFLWCLLCILFFHPKEDRYIERVFFSWQRINYWSVGTMTVLVIYFSTATGEISLPGPPPAPATEILTLGRYQERCLTSEQEATRQLPARTIEILLRPTNGHTHRGDVYSSQISLLRKAISGPPSSFLPSFFLLLFLLLHLFHPSPPPCPSSVILDFEYRDFRLSRYLFVIFRLCFFLDYVH